MNIRDMRIRKLVEEVRVRAVVSVTLDKAIGVHGVKVVQGDERIFVAMPSRKDEKGVLRDVVHPISPESRKEIEGCILAAYEEYLAAEESRNLQ